MYSTARTGTMITTEEKLANLFELDKIEYVLEADEYEPYGLYITDCFADSVIYSKSLKNGYSSLIGMTNIGALSSYVNGIINTHYKEKFSHIFEEYEKSKNDATYAINVSDDEYNAYYDYRYHYYNLSYSYEPNFINEYINTVSKTWVKVYMSDTNNALPFDFNVSVTTNPFEVDDSLDDDQIIISNGIINTETNKEYTVGKWNELLKDKYFSFSYSDIYGNDITEKVKISSGGGNKLSPKLYKSMLSNRLGVFSLYFKDVDKAFQYYEKSR